MENRKMVPEIRFSGFTDPWEQRKVSNMFRITRGYVLPATQTIPTLASLSIPASLTVDQRSSELAPSKTGVAM